MILWGLQALEFACESVSIWMGRRLYHHARLGFHGFLRAEKRFTPGYTLFIITVRAMRSLTDELGEHGFWMRAFVLPPRYRS